MLARASDMWQTFAFGASEKVLWRVPPTVLLHTSSVSSHLLRQMATETFFLMVPQFPQVCFSHSLSLSLRLSLSLYIYVSPSFMPFSEANGRVRAGSLEDSQLFFSTYLYLSIYLSIYIYSRANAPTGSAGEESVSSCWVAVAGFWWVLVVVVVVVVGCWLLVVGCCWLLFVVCCLLLLFVVVAVDVDVVDVVAVVAVVAVVVIVVVVVVVAAAVVVCCCCCAPRARARARQTHPKN